MCVIGNQHSCRHGVQKYLFVLPSWTCSCKSVNVWLLLELNVTVFPVPPNSVQDIFVRPSASTWFNLQVSISVRLTDLHEKTDFTLAEIFWPIWNVTSFYILLLWLPPPSRLIDFAAKRNCAEKIPIHDVTAKSFVSISCCIKNVA